MRNRNVKIQIWLSKKEAENLQKKAKRSNISVAAYLRHLINNMVPQEAPPPDYYAMMQQLYRIGNSLNQIAQKAHIRMQLVNRPLETPRTTSFSPLLRQVLL